MKKILILLLTVSLFLTGCGKTEIQKNEIKPYVPKYNESGVSTSGIWLSFSEINSMLKNPDTFKSRFEEAIQNMKTLKITDAYIHIRSYCDSLFKSDYFPLLDEAKPYDYDIFEYMLNLCHNNNIKVHAWINPYRVLSSSSDIEKVSSDSPAYKWLHDGNSETDSNVILYNGIYLNPAKDDVRELVINGIREVVSKYDIDGVHFDDYFYPTMDEAFDSSTYQSYTEQTKNPLSLDDYRRENVNSLISGCYNAIKYLKKDVLFTISPMASIERNYTDLYADVGKWVENKYIDVIIPQLYFGFDYKSENFQFENLVKQWRELLKKNEDVKLYIGLAVYKIGTQSEYDSDEWINKDDIIKRQVEYCINDNRISGFIYFSYTGLFSNEDINKRERENLLEFLN